MKLKLSLLLVAIALAIVSLPMKPSFGQDGTAVPAVLTTSCPTPVCASNAPGSDSMVKEVQ